MPNINLKYFIIVIISLSFLIVAGALLFRFLQESKPHPPVKQQNNMSQKPAPDTNTKQNTQIRIIYPSAEATRSSTSRYKTADTPKIEASGSSLQGSGGPKISLPKP